MSEKREKVIYWVITAFLGVFIFGWMYPGIEWILPMIYPTCGFFGGTLLSIGFVGGLLLTFFGIPWGFYYLRFIHESDPYDIGY